MISAVVREFIMETDFEGVSQLMAYLDEGTLDDMRAALVDAIWEHIEPRKR